MSLSSHQQNAFSRWRRTVAATALFACALASTAARAAGEKDLLTLSVADALASEYAKEMHADIPVYMFGQNHPRTLQELSLQSINSRTRSAMRSNERACQEAFIDALVWLQKRAAADGGNAIIDVTSNTKFQPIESPAHFRCGAGAFLAVVTLEGKIAKVAK